MRAVFATQRAAAPSDVNIVPPIIAGTDSYFRAPQLGSACNPDGVGQPTSGAWKRLQIGEPPAVMNEWGRWFGTYLETLTASARGDCDSLALLEYYGVPLLITGDDGFVALKSVDDVIGVMQGQVSRLRAAEYHHTDVCHADVEVLNSSSALCRATVAHRCDDGTQISELTATYLLTSGPAGVRISMLAVHADNGKATSARGGSA